MDYSKLTLGELLSSENETIKRHATGILKQLQKPEKMRKVKCVNCGEEFYQMSPTIRNTEIGYFCEDCWDENAIPDKY